MVGVFAGGDDSEEGEEGGGVGEELSDDEGEFIGDLA